MWKLRLTEVTWLALGTMATGMVRMRTEVFCAIFTSDKKNYRSLSPEYYRKEPFNIADSTGSWALSSHQRVWPLSMAFLELYPQTLSLPGWLPFQITCRGSWCDLCGSLMAVLGVVPIVTRPFSDFCFLKGDRFSRISYSLSSLSPTTKIIQVKD